MTATPPESNDGIDPDATHDAPNTATDPEQLGPRPRDVRRLAMQALFIIDATGQTDHEALLEALEDPVDEGEPDVPIAPKLPAIELALDAWQQRQDADAQFTKLAPDWPTHRQPPLDRAILRLAWFEMTTGRTDPALAINEAVDLAKQFCEERTPAFINGVLDRVAKRLPPELQTTRHDAAHPDPADPAATPPPRTGDAWLDDAVAD